MGIFSFDHYKTITTGEGGMVITDDLDLYHRAEWYHDHGHDHLSTVSRALDGRTILGFNYRMNEIQGAIGLAQLRKLNRVIAAQRKNKAAVMEVLAAIPGIKFRGMPDPEGDSATFLAFNLPAEEQTKAFQKALKAEGHRHGPFQGQFLALRPQLGALPGQVHGESKKNPFTDPRNRKVKYSRKAIPHAEDLLGRTLIMGISVKMPAAKMKAIRKAIANAAKVL